MFSNPEPVFLADLNKSPASDSIPAPPHFCFHILPDGLYAYSVHGPMVERRILLELTHTHTHTHMHVCINGAEAFLASPQHFTATWVLRQAYYAAKMGLCAVCIPRIKNKVRSSLEGYCHCFRFLCPPAQAQTIASD